jgi:hypothetical protein
MNWAERDVYGSTSFYTKPVSRSGFFLVDTLLLVFTSGIDIYALIAYGGPLGGPSIVRLLGVLLGVWLLWWKALATHQKIHALRQMEDGSVVPANSLAEAVSRTAASMTHIGMFICYLLNILLLMQLDSVLHHAR